MNIQIILTLVFMAGALIGYFGMSYVRNKKETEPDPFYEIKKAEREEELRRKQRETDELSEILSYQNGEYSEIDDDQ